MEKFDLYSDIAQRTNGDIYIGLVGPVRTGKSTFIQKFMDLMVLPNVQDAYARERVIDEMPQSGAGRTIMTTQPHFVPNEAVAVEVQQGAVLKIRLVDCVGYLVRGALGYTEDGEERMVHTPWFEQDIPFKEAAEIGTRKVIADHSTIGMVITTDGSITDIPRPSYIEAEERVIAELKELGKPFVLVMNTIHPEEEETQKLAETLALKYDVPVKVLNVMQMTLDDILSILSDVLFEFPLTEIAFEIPRWIQVLSPEHELVAELLDTIRATSEDMSRVRDYSQFLEAFSESERITGVEMGDINLGQGKVTLDVVTQPSLYYQVLSEECGFPVENEYCLFALLKQLAAAKQEYDRVAEAIRSVRETGYGLVSPTLEEMRLEEPEIVKQGGRFGVKLKASAPSLHMMRVDIETEVSPVVGTEKQSEELVKYLLSEFENDPQQIWHTNIFGKSLHELVKEGLSNKLARMPEDAQMKIAETLQRIINEGSGGLICILL